MTWLRLHGEEHAVTKPQGKGYARAMGRLYNTLFGLLLIATLAVAAFDVVAYRQNSLQTTELRIPESGGVLTLELADTPSKRLRGLSGRVYPSHAGLLLLWPQADQHPIWMSGMMFSLDLIWCDSNGRVTAVKLDVPACPPTGACPLYGALLMDTRAVVELPAGLAQELGIDVGDQLSIAALTSMRQTQ